MIVELVFRDCKSELWHISCTELTAPNVLEDRQGNYFLKCPVDTRIAVGKPDAPLRYLQCRGEKLSSIEVVRRSESAEDAA
jgi:hypothetical protein